MSIAIDEALEWHGLHGDEQEDRDSTYSSDAFILGYQAGHTAKLTKAEIYAAMTELGRHEYSHRVGEPIYCMCGAKLTDWYEYEVHLSRVMLEAELKSAME